MMHELGIAQAALQQTLEQARRAGATRVARIVLRVGALSGVDGEALRFAFTSILPGTAADGAALEIEPVPAVARCPDCQREFNPDADFIFTCPSCQRLCTALTQGRELELTRLEID
jgi:hydrogenase nickel incorporation protein HypA/HybF